MMYPGGKVACGSMPLETATPTVWVDGWGVSGVATWQEGEEYGRMVSQSSPLRGSAGALVRKAHTG